MTPTSTTRLDQLTPGLSPRERAVLCVRATLLDEKEDLRVRSTMPLDQSSEFNRLIGMANGVLHVLLPQALVLAQEVEALSLRHTLLLTIAAWGAHQQALRSALELVASMPIALSDYDRLVAEGRAEHIALAEAAEMLEVHDENEDVKSEAEYRRTVRQLIDSGQLKATGAGRNIRVELGSMYDYLAIVYEPRTDRGWRYQVFADEEYPGHRWRGELAERAIATVTGPSFAAGVPLDSDQAALSQSPFDALRAELSERVKAELQQRWSELVAIELVTDEVVQTFQDEVVVPEAMRSLLAGARDELSRLYEQGADLLDMEPLRDADEPFVSLLRKGLMRERYLYA
jgi:hypothetical protein